MLVIPQLIYVFLKDSKTISLFEPSSPHIKTNKKLTNMKGNFPHNFQMIQVGVQDPRVYLIGGGEYKTLPESMFQCKELIPYHNPQANFTLQMADRKNMKYARHGHSCCQILNRFVVVTGSRKEVN
mmetsp:Transcript_1064/g.1972  ORF Transcript_1064/g.1972 Transcript_1064/m.1972 type:complete len:126 (+) Transcript_1064:500-877(+)